MKIPFNSSHRRQSGYSALFITLILVGASVLMLGATLSRSTSGSRLNDRNNYYLMGQGAAEAAVEKALARMMVDFDTYGEAQVQSNLSFYSTSLLPTTSENSYWSNFVWSDAQGHNNQIYVARQTTAANAPYVALEEQYAGLSGYASTYRILANATMNNTTYNYGFTNAVQQDVQLAEIPVFQFAIFYNGLLEFSDTATLNVTGPVHANSNIYVGSPDALTFNSIVTTTGNITSPGNAGYGTGTWTGKVSYNATPTPGYLTGQPSLNLPIGTNSNVGSNVQQILYPPPASGDSVAMSQQRYYNNAGMTIVVSNSLYAVRLMSSSSDISPVILASTNVNDLNTNQYWTWISTTNTFYDYREKKQVNVIQIDVAKMTNWMYTNMYVYGIGAPAGNTKFNIANNPLNIVYVADFRTGGGALYAIRLVNGTTLPAAGLTVATPNPMYIQGLYNCPTTLGQNSTNTTLSSPASVACDAITILSPHWSDALDLTALAETATSDTVNTAIIAGIVPSTGTGSTQYSGGANNFPRLLEDWSNATLTLNTSMVCLFSSTWATGKFVLPGTYYYAPATRNFSFDLNYTSSAKLPPGTPKICRLIRATWCNPMPGDITYAPSPTLDFVPQ
jgi:hypothetical protein